MNDNYRIVWDFSTHHTVEARRPDTIIEGGKNSVKSLTLQFSMTIN